MGNPIFGSPDVVFESRPFCLKSVPYKSVLLIFFLGGGWVFFNLVLWVKPDSACLWLPVRAPYWPLDCYRAGPLNFLRKKPMMMYSLVAQ